MPLTPTPLPQGKGPKTLMMPDSRPASLAPRERGDGERGLGSEGNGAVIELTLSKEGGRQPADPPNTNIPTNE